MTEEELDRVRFLVEYKNGAGTTWDTLEEAERHLREDIDGRSMGSGRYLDPEDFVIRPVTFRELFGAGNTIDTYDEEGNRVSLLEES